MHNYYTDTHVHIQLYRFIARTPFFDTRCRDYFREVVPFEKGTVEMLQCVAVCCSVVVWCLLLCVVSFCSELQCVPFEKVRWKCCSVLQCGSVVLCVVSCCSELQCEAMRTIRERRGGNVAVCCSELQCGSVVFVIMCCIMLQ